MSLTVIEQAYAKVNLCLFMGQARDDGRHELVTVFDSVRLADELTVSEAESGVDEVVCAGVRGPNLVSGALAGLREAGWAAPPVRVEIRKRIPVAAGMGGGSADAAAMLRCAGRLAAVDREVVASIAARLGADVPGQLAPGPSLGTGAGELIEPLAALGSYALVVLPAAFSLATAAVYHEADRLGLGRGADELASCHDRVRETLAGVSEVPGVSAMLSPELMVNDLQPAALSLRPELSGALDAARDAGCDHAMVCGSGPTVIGVFIGAGAGARARTAAGDPVLRARFARTAAASPVHSAQSAVRL
jgi:4-diphosphocytidyl-2-C-methyl-D-erythritol kinase